MSSSHSTMESSPQHLHQLANQIISFYQNPSSSSSSSHHLTSLYNSISSHNNNNDNSTSAVAFLLTNYQGNPYILDFISRYICAAIDAAASSSSGNTDDAKYRLFELFVNHVPSDGKWWKNLLQAISQLNSDNSNSNSSTNRASHHQQALQAKRDNLQQLIIQLHHAMKEKSNSGPSAFPYALREAILIYLANFKQLDPNSPLTPVLTESILLLKEKELVLLAIRNHHDALLLNHLLNPIASSWNQEALVEIFCEIVTRRDNALLEWIVVAAEACTQWLTQVVDLQEKNQQQPISDSLLRRIVLTVQLIIQNHILKLERHSFSVQKLLLAFFRFTFSPRTVCSENVELYMECLEVWSCLSLSIAEDEQREKYYESCIRELVPKILQHSLFSQNGQQIMIHLDNTMEHGTQFQTELDEYLTRCVDCLAVICAGTINSNRFISMIYDLMVDLVVQYQQHPNGASEKSQKLARDAQTLMILLSQFASFLLDSFDTYRSIVQRFLQGTIELGKHLLSNGFLEQSRQHRALFVNCLHIYQTFFPWIRHLQTQDPSQSLPLVHAITDLLVSSFQNPSHEWIVQESARCFSRLVTVVRCPHLHENESFQKLCNQLPQLSNMDSSLKYVVPRIHLSVSNSILFPNREGNLHSTEWKQQVYAQYFSASVAKPLQAFLQSTTFTANPQSSLVTQHLALHLKILTQLLKSIQDLNLTKRKIFFEQFAPLRPAILQLFSLYKDSSELMTSLLALVQAIFKSLQSQIGVEFIENIMNSFLQSLSRPEYVIQFIESPKGKKFVKKLLSLQIILMADGNQRFRPLLPTYLKIAKDLIYTAISKSDSSSSVDIQSDFFELLYTVLHQHFDYFSPDSHAQELAFIMQCFLSALQSVEIHLLQQTLNYLRNLNASHLLFKRNFFLNHYQKAFVETLMQVLKSRNHELSNDRIISVLYDMSQEGQGMRFVCEAMRRNIAGDEGTGKVTEPKFRQELLTWTYEDS